MTSKATTVEQDLRQRLAAELHRIADDLVTQQLPLYDLLSARLHLGVLDSRADLQRWADYLGVEIEEDGGTDDNIPNVEHEILFGERRWGPSFAIHAQISSAAKSVAEEADSTIKLDTEGIPVNTSDAICPNCWVRPGETHYLSCEKVTPEQRQAALAHRREGAR